MIIKLQSQPTTMDRKFRPWELILPKVTPLNPYRRGYTIIYQSYPSNSHVITIIRRLKSIVVKDKSNCDSILALS
jgi:hypothetical protein